MDRRRKILNCIQIFGGKPLYGKVKIQGSKNTVLPIIAATVLHRGISVLHNCPRIDDVFHMVEILKCIGCKVLWSYNTLIIDAKEINSCEIPKEYADKMRSSVILLGSLLGRLKTVKLPFPGGCVIGERPIDLHLLGLSKLQVEIEEVDGAIHAQSKGLVGVDLSLAFPSVGATQNILLACILAKGTTIIRNCAKEPEVEELCNFLKSMGAKIEGIGTDILKVEGVEHLKDVEYEIVADRIVAGTYFLAAVATRGQILVTNPPKGHLGSLYEILKNIGVRLWETKEGLVIDAKGELIVPQEVIETEPYPGFPTDLQSPLIAVLTTIAGNSRIRENIFEERFKVIEQLNQMGAHIKVEGKDAYIYGGTKLYGCHVQAKELRGGAALVIAGLCASGVTVIENRHFIDRGYEDIIRDFMLLGASITSGCIGDIHEKVKAQSIE